MAAKYVYFFGNGKADGGTEMKNLLGGKGANLAEMTSSAFPFLPDLPLPPRSAPSFTKTSVTTRPGCKRKWQRTCAGWRS